MHKFSKLVLVSSFCCFSSNILAYNLFSFKVEGGFNMTPEGVVLSNSTLTSADTDKFSARWVSDNKSGSSKNKTDNTAYVGAGVVTRNHPAIPVRGELLFSYYPKYKLKYHGRGVTGFPETATLTSELERHTVFLNVYGDLLKVKTSGNILDFFVQAGVGAAVNTMKDIVVSGATNDYTLTRESDNKSARDNSLAWNIGAGMNVSFYEDYTVGVGYRYVNFKEAKSSNVSLNSNGTWDRTRNPFNIKTDSHLVYLSLAFA